jgi:hypothetical protein
MTSYELKARLKQLARDDESCDTCNYQSKITCTYSGEEHRKPVVAGKTVCRDHNKKATKNAMCPHYDKFEKKCKLCDSTFWNNLNLLGAIAEHMCFNPKEYPSCAVPNL